MAGSDCGGPAAGQAPGPAGRSESTLLGLAVLCSLPLIADAVTVYGWGIYVYYLRAPYMQLVYATGVLLAGGWPLYRRAGVWSLAAAAGAAAYGVSAWAAFGARWPGRYFISGAAIILCAHLCRAVAAYRARRKTT